MWNKFNILLAVQIVQQNFKSNFSKIARIYNIPRTILFNKILGLFPQVINFSNLRKFTNLKEKVIVRYIFELNLRVFFSRRNIVENITNRLFAKRDKKRVKKNWTSNFVRQQLQLFIRFIRKIDY